MEMAAAVSLFVGSWVRLIDGWGVDYRTIFGVGRVGTLFSGESIFRIQNPRSFQQEHQVRITKDG